MRPAFVLSTSLVLAGLLLFVAADLTAANQDKDKAAKAEEKSTAAPDALGRDDDNTQHVFYFSPDGDLMEVYWAKAAGWQRKNLTAEAKSPKGTGKPTSYVLKYGKNSQHVVYRGDDGQIHEVSFPSKDNKWVHNNLSTATKAPKAAGNPYGYVFNDTTQHIVFRTAEGDIYELNHQPKGDKPGWYGNNLSTDAKSSKAAGDPCGYVFDKMQHVVYRNTDGHIVELFHKPDDARWQTNVLTEAAKAPKAAGDPCGYELKYSANTQHVIYRCNEGQIHELFYPVENKKWAHNNLSAATKAPKATGKPCGYVFGDTTQHIVFRTTDGDIYELNHQPKGDAAGWRGNNLSTDAKSPKAASDPSGYVLDKTMHVFFMGTDNNLYELSMRPGTSTRWQMNNLTTETKGK